MSNSDPTKYKQIANENTLCEYILWQTFRIRDNAIERDQLNQNKTYEDTTSKSKNRYTREEMTEMIDKGVFN